MAAETLYRVEGIPDAFQRLKPGDGGLHCGRPEDKEGVNTILWILAGDKDGEFNRKDNVDLIQKVAGVAHVILLRIENKNRLESGLKRYGATCDQFIFTVHGNPETLFLSETERLSKSDITKDLFYPLKERCRSITLITCEAAKNGIDSIAAEVAFQAEKVVLAYKSTLSVKQIVLHPSFEIGGVFPFFFEGSCGVKIQPDRWITPYSWKEETTDEELEKLLYLSGNKDKQNEKLQELIIHELLKRKRFECVFKAKDILVQPYYSTIIKSFFEAGETEKALSLVNWAISHKEFDITNLFSIVETLVKTGYYEQAREYGMRISDLCEIQEIALVFFNAGQLAYGLEFIKHLEKDTRSLDYQKISETLKKCGSMELASEYLRKEYIRAFNSLILGKGADGLWNFLSHCDDKLNDPTFSFQIFTYPNIYDPKVFLPLVREGLKKHAENKPLFRAVCEYLEHDPEDLDFGAAHLFDSAEVFAHAMMS